MTLLQNKRNILPLSKNRKIAVVGPNADDARLLWGNYNGTPVKTITILEGIKSLSNQEVFYDKGCDLVDDMILESFFNQCTIEGQPGMKATFWNNKERAGAPVTSVHYDQPIRLSTTGQHPFAPGVKLRDFSGVFETILKPVESGEIVFRLQSIGDYRLSVNDEIISDYTSWRFVTKRIPYPVEKDKEYRIRINFTQNCDFASANLNFNVGKESPVNYDELIKKLRGIDVVVFAGGISGELEGEEMPIELPGFKGGDRTDIELPASQRSCIKALKDAGKK